MLHEGDFTMVGSPKFLRWSVEAVCAVSTSLLVVVLAGACSNGPGEGSDLEDTGEMDAGITDASDVDEKTDTPEDTSQTDGGDTGEGSFLCSSCSEDSDCGGPDDQCRELDGEQVCTRACDLQAEEDPCPDEYQCARVSQVSDQGQCVPDQLTCSDFCEQTDCEDGKVCDPLLKECREPLSLCDTRCTVDSVCGDGPEDQCLSLSSENESQQERICSTACDPQGDVSECPVDYRCVALEPDNEESPGVCFPLAGTCVDRCADTDCPEGQNCNATTGQCEPSEYGACEVGCESNAQCGGQEDWCLNLLDSEQPHCYEDCSDTGDSCPSGYDCLPLSNSSKAFCVPGPRRCEACEGNDCGDDEVCDPTDGSCEPIDRDCTTAGCEADGEVCDPRSTDCVEVGRSCSGGSWAQDCDNVVTTCTTHRSGTTGSCERICSGDSECPGAETSCVSTNFQSMCLDDEFGGPETCGTLHRSNTNIGAPCSGDGDCSGDADRCIQDGNIEGFCSTDCSSDGDCPGDQRCGRGPSGGQICLPTQCECAADIGLASKTQSGLESALGNVDLDQCEVALEATDANDRVEELSETPLASDRLEGRIELPLVGQRRVVDEAAALDRASDTPASALDRAADAAGMSIDPSAGSHSFGGQTSKLTQAVSQLIDAAGGTPNTSRLENEAQNVPQGYQDVAAPIIAEVADAYEKRDQALTNAGWDDSQRQSAFDGAPYLFLPGTSSQQSDAPDLSDASVRQTYGQFPDQQFGAAAGDLGATVSDALANVSDADDWQNIDYTVDTPAGKVVLGGSEDTTYDPSQNSSLSGDIAVIIDVGGNDTYRVPAGANTSPSNGVSLVVDKGGDDTYTYDKAGDPMLDTDNLLVSDGDGRKQPAGPIQGNNGPVSLSATARQGAGRVGIGMLLDYGEGNDIYESLRMSQGASVFGVGLLFDGGGGDSYTSEALAQGGALGGLGVVWSAGGPDQYKVWHGGQGFGTAAGTGVAFDRAGADTYTAVRGETGGDGVLYLSPADRGASNRNLAQGAGAGIESDSSTTGLAGGTGLLRDAAGDDTYTSATYAQGFGAVRGIGLLSDAEGSDTYRIRAVGQAAGEYLGGGVFHEAGGDDQYNQNGLLRSDGQGFGRAFGWGVFRDADGSDQVKYLQPGGGVGFDGGYGFALFGGGQDTHDIGAPTGWGFANNTANMSDALYQARTVGIFVDVGGDEDDYSRPQVGSTNIGNEATWLQPDPATDAEKGSGLDD
jgi:hypothetical protein